MKVKSTDIIYDITYCTNHKCRKKTCYRHICHCGYLSYHSEAHFEGNPQYCLKEQEEIKKEKQND